MEDVRKNVQGIIVQCCDSVGGFLRINTEGLQDILTEQVDAFATNFQGQVMPKVIGESWTYRFRHRSTGGHYDSNNSFGKGL